MQRDLDWNKRFMDFNSIFSLMSSVSKILLVNTARRRGKFPCLRPRVFRKQPDERNLIFRRGGQPWFYGFPRGFHGLAPQALQALGDELGD